VSIRGVLTAAGVETTKLTAQWRPRLVLTTCAAAPLVFAAALRLQSSLPTDTLFGRAIDESGFAVPLVILGFAAFWVFPAAASLVGGDLFSAEDRYGTWATVLTRSRSRGELFAGKALTAIGFAIVAIVILSLSSLAAGTLIIGRQPLIDLSGVSRSAPEAALRVALAWASVLPPVLGFAALAMLTSIATRSSAAGIGLPVVIGLSMQLCEMLDGREGFRQLLISSAFGAWHGLLTEPSYYRPLIYAVAVSAAYVVVCLTCGYRLLRRRDIVR
jgi:ABC-2 type transport system permease protein